ncbi:MAG TPA: hypothetical protein VEG32_05775 [Clostridia bacterium]|nr:hypothetical protein [Clostridia bacterium]
MRLDALAADGRYAIQQLDFFISQRSGAVPSSEQLNHAGNFQYAASQGSRYSYEDVTGE